WSWPAWSPWAAALVLVQALCRYASRVGWRVLPPRLAWLAGLATLIILAPPASARASAPKTPPCVLRAGFVDGEGAAAHFLAVQRVNGFFRFTAIAHFHETKAARTAGLAISDHRYAFDIAIRSKERLQVRLSGAEREVADKKFHFVSFAVKVLRGCS